MQRRKKVKGGKMKFKGMGGVEEEEESESSRGGITGRKPRPKPLAPPNRLPIIRLRMVETI